MRINFTYIILLLAFLGSCKTASYIVTHPDISGTWKIVDIDTGVEVEETIKADYEKIKAQMLDKAYMKFDKDNHFEMFFLGQLLKGKWEFKDEKLVTTSEGRTESDQFSFFLENENKLILTSHADGDKIILTLTREQ